MNTKYNVISIGIKKESERSQVVQEMAKLFGISIDKAQILSRKTAVIKKNIDHEKALRYQKKLVDIGLDIRIRPINVTEQQAVDVAPKLASQPVSPMESPETASTAKFSLGGDDELKKEETKPREIPSIKEKVEQSSFKNNVLCVNQETESAANLMNSTPLESNMDQYESEEVEERMAFLKRPFISNINIFGILLGIAVTLLWVLLWHITVTTLNIENYAWSAILIGGSIGLAVRTTSGGGHSTAILCAVLALVAILFGKLWTIQSEMQNVVSQVKEEMRPRYVAMKTMAEKYQSNMTDEEFKGFLFDYNGLGGSSDAFDEFSKNASPEILQLARIAVEPELEELSNSTYDEWFAYSIQELKNEMNFTVINVLKKRFNFLDAIFLLLGVFTAYRVGYANKKLY